MRNISEREILLKYAGKSAFFDPGVAHLELWTCVEYKCRLAHQMGNARQMPGDPKRTWKARLLAFGCCPFLSFTSVLSILSSVAVSDVRIFLCGVLPVSPTPLLRPSTRAWGLPGVATTLGLEPGLGLRPLLLFHPQCSSREFAMVLLSCGEGEPG